jgi:hypothetical protein
MKTGLQARRFVQRAARLLIFDVRFCGRYWVQSGHALLHCICPLMTQSGHFAVSPALLLSTKTGQPKLL